MNSYSYFPGCSLEGMTSSYDISTRRVAEVFDLDLVELEDWNCCGATSYMSMNELLSFSISARCSRLSSRYRSTNSGSCRLRKILAMAMFT